MTSTPAETAKVLRKFNAWRTEDHMSNDLECPAVGDVTAAIDAGIAALETVARIKTLGYVTGMGVCGMRGGLTSSKGTVPLHAKRTRSARHAVFIVDEEKP